MAAVLSLAVVLVLLTVAAWALELIVPQVGWAAAVALGGIVAPPDASAATAVLRKLEPPHRLLVILEGESLFNDATALLIYRVAVGAAITGAFSRLVARAHAAPHLRRRSRGRLGPRAAVDLVRDGSSS